MRGIAGRMPMKSIHPNEKQMADFPSKKDDGPVVMINLLKFKNTSTAERKQSEERYTKYMMNVAPLLFWLHFCKTHLDLFFG